MIRSGVERIERAGIASGRCSALSSSVVSRERPGCSPRRRPRRRRGTAHRPERDVRARAADRRARDREAGAEHGDRSGRWRFAAPADPGATVAHSPPATAKRSITDRGTAPALGSDSAARSVRPTDRRRTRMRSPSRSADRPGAAAGRQRAAPAQLGLVAPLGVTRALAVPGGLLTPVAQVVDPVLAPVTGVPASGGPVAAARRRAVSARSECRDPDGDRRPARPARRVHLGCHARRHPASHGSVPSGIVRHDRSPVRPRRPHRGPLTPSRASSGIRPGSRSARSGPRRARNAGEQPGLPYPAPMRGEGSGIGHPGQRVGLADGRWCVRHRSLVGRGQHGGLPPAAEADRRRGPTARRRGTDRLT